MIDYRGTLYENHSLPFAIMSLPWSIHLHAQ